jgi:thiol:disulfide interchange protein DsbD
MMKNAAFKLSTIVLAWGLAFGQGAYKVRLQANPDHLSAGQSGRLVLEMQLSEGYHVSTPDKGLFVVEPEPSEGIVFGKAEYPSGVMDTFGLVYKGKIQVKTSFKILESAPTGVRKLAIKATIQQCGESQGVCYPPEEVRVEARLTVATTEETSMPASGNNQKKDIAGRVSDALKKGSFTAFLLVFLGGLLTSFTPCVYPMIPITIAVIGAQASGKKRGGFILSLFYVLGIALTFSGLGMIAAKTGALFGSVMNHPIFTVIIASIFFIMGLSMLGAFVIQMPSAFASKLRVKKRQGFVGAFLTGILAGLVVSSCISPLLVVILTWVAKKGSLLLGFGLLFSFALGLGVLFIVIGTFSGALRLLPKSGLWMELIERGFGILLVTLAIVFLKPILSPFLYTCLWAAYLVFVGTFLGAFTPLDKDGGSRQKISKAVAVLLVIVGGILLFIALNGRFQKTEAVTGGKAVAVKNERISWIFSESDAFQQSQIKGKPILIDFFAEWCAACRELDEKTWPDSSVRRIVSGFVPLKMDMTEKNKYSAETQKKYGILGMPTVVVWNADGRELGRFSGFKPPKEVTQFLRKYVH